MSHPLISIVVPIYNAEPYIANTIRSIIAQTITDYELILVNDGSTDRSLNIAHTMLIGHKVPIRTITQPSQGQYSARNTGASIARGEWLLFLDSDDTLVPDALQRMAQVIEQNDDIDIIVPDFQRVRPGNEFKLPAYDRGIEMLTRQQLQMLFLTRRLTILAPSTLFRRSWYEAHHLSFPSILFTEDVYFTWNMLMYVERACHLRCPIYNYLQRRGSVMSSTSAEILASAQNAFQGLAEHYGNTDAPDDVKKYLYPRYILGVMHTGARICSAAEYRRLGQKLDAKSNMRQLRKFPCRKTRLAATTYLASPRLFRLLLH